MNCSRTKKRQPTVGSKTPRALVSQLKMRTASMRSKPPQTTSPLSVFVLQTALGLLHMGGKLKQELSKHHGRNVTLRQESSTQLCEARWPDGCLTLKQQERRSHPSRCEKTHFRGSTVQRHVCKTPFSADHPLQRHRHVDTSL